MKTERIAEIRALANPAQNARWLAKLLNECLDAIEELQSTVRLELSDVDWTADVNVTVAPPRQRPVQVGELVTDDTRVTTEYGPGLAERLLRTGEQHDVITSAVRPPPSGVVAEKVGPEETAPAKRGAKEKK